MNFMVFLFIQEVQWYKMDDEDVFFIYKGITS